MGSAISLMLLVWEWEFIKLHLIVTFVLPFQIGEKMFQPGYTCPTAIRVMSCSVSRKRCNNRVDEALYRNYVQKKGEKTS